jgi:cobyrinic acid a,c-diamide synthase
MMSLISHVFSRRKRIYAEGGGAVYLGQSIIVAGEVHPGVGIFPFSAELLQNPRLPYPVERTLLYDTWLAPSGTKVRGYHCARWALTPKRPAESLGEDFGPLNADRDVWSHQLAVGSLIHLHLASLPKVVEAFAGPRQAFLPSH